MIIQIYIPHGICTIVMIYDVIYLTIIYYLTELDPNHKYYTRTNKPIDHKYSLKWISLYFIVLKNM